MRILCLSITIIFLSTSKITFASQWTEGNRLVIQGLDKITARIKTFEVDVSQTYKFGVLDIFVERCVFSKPIFKPESLAYIKIKITLIDYQKLNLKVGCLLLVPL